MDRHPDEATAGPNRAETSGRQIGVEAAALDRERTAVERMRLPRAALRRLTVLGVVYVAVIAGITVVGGTETGGFNVVPTVVALAFVLETTDSAAGMGFGTGLAPLLFVLGYDPLQVVPVLLLSETLTGLVAGAVHQTVANVTFSVRPLNRETRLLGLFVGFGSLAVFLSVGVAYFAFTFSDAVIEAYVAFLVLAMGVTGLVRARLQTRIEFRPRRLVAFAVLAGVNKGIGGGGYGPVVTLGQILSGVYEKSAVAITTLAEGIVSIVGVLSFLVLLAYGVQVDFRLLPSIFTGGFLAAIVAPYLVRVVPNGVWRYLIPLYAFGIGLTALVLGLGV
ncbi:TSUP family transporter [Halobacterium wangiae]|uniref:TSUP family transporter n=1 Tax=Halobacterium wangiae TaxID=2902623 RepID=UPI001E44E285|nr:TSUP family transporter [Halobacterium wangiae]